MESDLKWDLKAQITHRNTNTNTNARRFSASNFKSFREDERFLRPTTISSTVSSPGYSTRDKIDPSTYSFTAAIKALQAKGNACSWEHLPVKRATLHSKWSDAEKYISNPLSGEVPVECLSAKTLSARSFSSLTNRITISAPLLYPSHFQTKFPIIQHQHSKLNITIQEEKKGSTVTRDVGTQSTPVDLSSGSSPSTAPPTPSIRERLTQYSEGESGDSSLSNEKENPKKEGEERETKEEKESRKTKEGRERKKMMMMCIQGGGRRGCCLSLKGLLQRDKKCKPRKIKKPAPSSSSSSPTYLYHINACYDDFLLDRIQITPFDTIFPVI